MPAPDASLAPLAGPEDRGGRGRRFARPGLGEARIHSRDYGGETVVRWQAASPLTLLGGINILHLDLDQQINVTRLVGLGEFRDKQDSLALFADATFEQPLFTATAGLRYQRHRTLRSWVSAIFEKE